MGANSLLSCARHVASMETLSGRPRSMHLVSSTRHMVIINCLVLYGPSFPLAHQYPGLVQLRLLCVVTSSTTPKIAALLVFSNVLSWYNGHSEFAPAAVIMGVLPSDLMMLPS